MSIDTEEGATLRIVNTPILPHIGEDYDPPRVEDAEGPQEEGKKGWQGMAVGGGGQRVG